MEEKSMFSQEKKFPVRLLSVKETAVYLGLSPRTIYNRLSRGSKRPFPIRPKRVGKLVKFDIRDVEAYVELL
jgi:excisionase family DNA binding protein